jgi:hypothetical protein
MLFLIRSGHNRRPILVKVAIGSLLVCASTFVGAQAQSTDTVGAIDFYGYQSLDLARIRPVLPVHIGDPLTDQTIQAIQAAVVRAIGKEPTEVAQPCCDAKGRVTIYIGLPGATYQPFALNPAPTGKEGLPPQIIDLDNRIGDAIDAAVHKGGAAATEDDSQGFALVNDPAARELQMQERAFALTHGPKLLRILHDTADPHQREIACEALGYAQQSPEQIAALVYASRDPDPLVRNNATRALAVLVRSNPKLATQIDPAPFIAMLSSGIWSDRNKAALLLDPMTVGRDPQLLAKIRAGAFAQLVEMAKWTEVGHAIAARLALGRIAGIPEDKLQSMALTGPPDGIIAAAKL